MSLLSETVARLRVCRAAGIHASPELVALALVCLENVADAEVLRAKRDELLRLAGRMVDGPSNWARAATLEVELKRLRRSRGLLSQQPGPPFTPRACLHRAMLLSDVPGSRRQLYRIIAAVN